MFNILLNRDLYVFFSSFHLWNISGTRNNPFKEIVNEFDGRNPQILPISDFKFVKFYNIDSVAWQTIILHRRLKYFKTLKLFWRKQNEKILLLIISFLRNEIILLV